jgi:hypothetical protein
MVQLEARRKDLRRSPAPECSARRQALPDIDPNSPGLILLGRREPEVATKDRRRHYGRELNIRIHSIDWLLNNREALNLHDAG